ncbi:MAG: hypothetical protein ABEJ44_04455 [Halanaeroarchaeum sp.]
MATRVRHYDELAPKAKERLPELLSGESAVVSPETAAGFRHGEVVKFTGYYRIEVLDEGVGIRVDSMT